MENEKQVSFLAVVGIAQMPQNRSQHQLLPHPYPGGHPTTQGGLRHQVDHQQVHPQHQVWKYITGQNAVGYLTVHAI